MNNHIILKTDETGDECEQHLRGISFADCVSKLFELMRDVPEQFVCGRLLDCLKAIAEDDDFEGDDPCEITATDWDMIDRVTLTYVRD